MTDYSALRNHIKLNMKKEESEKHKIGYNKLNRVAAHRKPLSAIWLYRAAQRGKILTTKAKAIEARRAARKAHYQGKLILSTIAGSHSAQTIREDAVAKLFTDIGPRFKERNGVIYPHSPTWRSCKRRGQSCSARTGSIIRPMRKSRREKTQSSAQGQEAGLKVAGGVEMSKAHRGKGLREVFARGRGTCPRVWAAAVSSVVYSRRSKAKRSRSVKYARPTSRMRSEDSWRICRSRPDVAVLFFNQDDRYG
jgi:large subunit ribosomal protein L17